MVRIVLLLGSRLFEGALLALAAAPPGSQST